MRILWKLEQLDQIRASVRYRATYPAMSLRRLGHDVVVTDDPVTDLAELSRFDCIVFSKSFRWPDVNMAHAANCVGVPYVMDLCDNIFFPDYGLRQGLHIRAAFMGMAPHAAAVVTPSDELARVLQAHVPEGVPVQVIFDPVETLELVNSVVFSAPRYGPLQLLVSAFRYGRSLIVRARFALGRALRVPWPGKLQALLHLPVRAITLIGLRASIGLRLLARRLWGAVTNLVSRLLSCLFRVVVKPEESFRAVVRSLSTDRKLSVKERDTQMARAVIASQKRSEVGRKTVVWFGSHGSPYGDSGMGTLLELRAALAEVASAIPIRLLIVSNNLQKFNDLIRPFPFPTEYREWDPHRIFRDLAGSDVCILPNSNDEFSKCKSANRVTLALSMGVPVVSSTTGALGPIRDYVILDDWVGGITTYLTDPERAIADVGNAQRVLAETYSLSALAERWQYLFRDVVDKHAAWPVDCLFFVDLVQDLDVLLPILRAAMARADIGVRVWISQNAAGASPRVLTEIKGLGLEPRIVSRGDVISGDLRGITIPDAVITASESTAGPHRAGHALVDSLRNLGVKAYTCQHGLENVGLTYFDRRYGLDIRFSSDRIFLWGSGEGLPPDLDADTRAKCLPVGCWKEVPIGAPAKLPLPAHTGPVVAVFENLHWERYNDAYRAAFIADLAAVVARFPETLFVIKPHHAGQWWLRADHEDMIAASNVILASPQNPVWEPYTAPAIIAAADSVITTPSTVALDAARAGKPVAVVANGLDLPVYTPLPLLNGPNDWAEFLSGPDANALIEEARGAFLARQAIRGDPVSRIMSVIVEDVAARRGRR